MTWQTWLAIRAGACRLATDQKMLRGKVLRDKFIFCAFCVSCAVAGPAAAQVFRAVNLLYVVPITADTFEVIDDRGASAQAMWCAGADYARRAGLDGIRKRMYVVEPRGPSRTRARAIAVTFTTNPPPELADSPSTYSVSVKRAGDNYAIGHAYNFCGSLIDDVFDRF